MPEHANVTAAGRDWEHYDRRGPGCWHPVGGGICHSWQALIREAESAAAVRERQLIVAYLREFIGHGSARDIEECRHLDDWKPLRQPGPPVSAWDLLGIGLAAAEESPDAR